MSSAQISEGPNPAIDDLSPDTGNITFPVGHAVAQFTVLVRDDQVSPLAFPAVALLFGPLMLCPRDLPGSPSRPGCLGRL